MGKLYSVETGAIVSKEQAAVSAMKRVDAAGAEMLRAAAREYRSEEQVGWDRESSRVSGAVVAHDDPANICGIVNVPTDVAGRAGGARLATEVIRLRHAVEFRFNV